MIFTRLRTLHTAPVVVAALVLSVAAVSAQAPAREARPADKGLIWEFERDGRTGWLVGSIHQLPADFHPLPQVLSEEFARADTLVEEVDIDEASNPALAITVISKAMYPPGTTLSSQLSPETAKVSASIPPLASTSISRTPARRWGSLSSRSKRRRSRSTFSTG
jgi:uncharacterized protein YbaP (TraB family)